MHLLKCCALAASLLMTGTAVADNLVTAVLPTSRSTVFGKGVTVFATVINTSGRPLHGCSVRAEADGSGFVTLNYQLTDPTTNAVVGVPDPLFALDAGASQSLVLSLSSLDAMEATQVRPTVDCVDPAGPDDVSTSTDGLNTILFSDGPQATPDVIALVASPSNDGVLRIQGAGSNAFAVAVSNVGSGDTITASIDTGDIALPVTASICQTGIDGQCLQPPAATTSLALPTNGTASFGVFVTADGQIPFYPARARVFVRFSDSLEVVRGATSVAVSNTPAVSAALPRGGIFEGNTISTGVGIKSGTKNSGVLLLAEDGEAQWVNDAGDVVSGSLSIAPDLSLSGSVLYQNFGLEQFTSDDLQGVIAQRAWFGAEVVSNQTLLPTPMPSRLSMAGSYLANLYERGSSLDRVSGAWNLRSASGDLIGMANFTSSGTYSATISGCQFSGQIGLIDTRYGIYRMNASFSNCPAQNFVGLAALYDVQSLNDTLLFIGNNATFGLGADIVFDRN